MSEDFLKQLRSEVRAEAALAATRKYAALCIALVLLAIAGLGVWQWHRHALQEEARKASASFYAASMQLLEPSGPIDTAAAITSMGELSKSAPGEIRFYAGIQLAAAQIHKGEVKPGLSLLQKIASDPSASPVLQSYARYMRLNAAFALHALPESEIRAGYEALARDGGGWKPFAQEGLLATDLAPGLSAERKAEAQRLAESLSREPEVPESIRQRAATVTSILKAGTYD